MLETGLWQTLVQLEKGVRQRIVAVTYRHNPIQAACEIRMKQAAVVRMIKSELMSASTGECSILARSTRYPTELFGGACLQAYDGGGSLTVAWELRGAGSVRVVRACA